METIKNKYDKYIYTVSKKNSTSWPSYFILIVYQLNFVLIVFVNIFELPVEF